MSKIQIAEPINATPSKLIYRSIIADYDLETALAELIDNVIDSSRRSSLQRVVTVDVDLDFQSQTIDITDNAGGVMPEHLPKLIRPGATDNDGGGNSIGIFGIGSKRAAVALASDIKIQTRHGKSTNSFLLEYDDDWLADDDNWDVPYYRINPIRENTTKIRLSRLRFQIVEKDQSHLITYFGKLYAYFLKDQIIEIKINGTMVIPIVFDQWSFSPSYEPHAFERRMIIPDRRLPFLFKITSGLTWEQGSIHGNYGVYIYCNRRLILAAAKLGPFGFQKGVAGVPHPRMSNARVIIELSGAASDMPWISNKTGINFNHEIMRLIGDDIQTAVKNATGLSKKLQPQFDDLISPYKSGAVVFQKLKKDEHIKPSKLPVIPKTQKSKKETIVELNKKTIADKLYTAGIVDSLVAANLIKEKTKLQFKNRVILIILDSCLEIALKDYLVYETPNSIAEARLQSLNRIQLEGEVQKFIYPNDAGLWKKVQYFYKLRCDLTHKRSSATINDDHLDAFEKLLEKLFKKMFGMKFPTD